MLEPAHGVDEVTGDAVRELDDAVRELAVLANRPRALEGDPRERANRWQRACLLYSARTPSGWVLRVVFYLSTAFLLLGGAGLLVAGDFAALAGFAAVCGPVVLVLRATTIAADKPTVQRTRKPLERWLLFYPPRNWRVGLVHGLFFLLSLVCSIGWIMAVVTYGSDPQWSDGVVGFAVFTGVMLAVRGWARSLDVAEDKPAAVAAASGLR